MAVMGEAGQQMAQWNSGSSDTRKRADDMLERGRGHGMGATGTARPSGGGDGCLDGAAGGTDGATPPPTAGGGRGKTEVSGKNPSGTNPWEYRRPTRSCGSGGIGGNGQGEVSKAPCREKLLSASRPILSFQGFGVKRQRRPASCVRSGRVGRDATGTEKVRVRTTSRVPRHGPRTATCANSNYSCRPARARGTAPEGRGGWVANRLAEA